MWKDGFVDLEENENQLDGNAIGNEILVRLELFSVHVYSFFSTTGWHLSSAALISDVASRCFCCSRSHLQPTFSSARARSPSSPPDLSLKEALEARVLALRAYCDRLEKDGGSLRRRSVPRGEVTLKWRCDFTSCCLYYVFSHVVLPPRPGFCHESTSSSLSRRP